MSDAMIAIIQTAQKSSLMIHYLLRFCIKIAAAERTVTIADTAVATASGLTQLSR
jgi:hypothetical protein